MIRPQEFHPEDLCLQSEKKMKEIINSVTRAHRSLGPRPRDSSITKTLNEP